MEIHDWILPPINLATGAASTTMLPTRLIRRTRGPAIAWAPAHDAYYVLAGVLRSGRGTPPLHLTQEAIVRLSAHLRETTSSLPYGLLVGGLCACPKTKLDYLLIDEVIRASTELTADDPRAQLVGALRSLTLEASQREKLTLGWYIGGMGAELQPDPEVAGVHREVFPDPWQVVLLHDRAASVETGAVVRFETLTARSYAIPFFELLPEKSAHGKQSERRTALRWANYRTAEQVLPLEDAELVTAERGSARAAPPSRLRLKEWLQPFRRGAGAAVQQQLAPSERASFTSVDAPIEQVSHTRIIAEPLIRPTGATVPIAPAPSAAATLPTLQPAGPVREVAAADNQTVAQTPTGRTAAAEESPAVSVSAPGTQHVFIDGDLISFDELPPVYTDEQLFPSVYRRRGLAMAALVTLAALVALGAYAVKSSL